MVNNKLYPTVELEEHYVVVGEPGEFYLSHLTPDTGKGSDVAAAIYKLIESTTLQGNLRVIGSDGTAAMTGCWSGCIARLEEMLGRPLQWAICLLHCIELPLRHVFKTLDGVTKSPDTFSGPIGECLIGPVSD